MVKSFFPAFVAGAVLSAVVSVASAAPVHTHQTRLNPEQSADLPFQSGERLTYEISWSRLIQAGIAVMEVREQDRSDGKQAYHLMSHAYSTGMLSRFYRIADSIESYVAVDGDELYTLSYHLDQHHGKRVKKRDMLFDQEAGKVVVLADGAKETYPIPPDVQDALSSLYYVRTRQNFIVGKPMYVNVHEDGKNWAVEVQTLGRERLQTKFGDLRTIKIRTYPRYDGVFQNTGEITIWLTDDARKIPVLMRSTISIGSIVATLIDVHLGENKHDVSHGIKASLKPH